MKQPLIDEHGEVRELNQDDFSRMRPISEFPELSILKTAGRPKASIVKTSTTMRLDKSTIEYFKKQGRGWQTRINEILGDYVKTHS